MEESKLAKIFNFAFILAGLALTFYFVLIRLTKNFYLAIILTILGVIISLTEIFYAKNKKLKKLNIERTDLKNKSSCDNFFLTFPQSEILSFLQNLFSSEIKLNIKNDYLINQESATIIYPFFDSVSLKKDDLIKLTKLKNQQKVNKLIVFCFNSDSALINQENIVILNSLELFSFMKEKNIFPIDFINQNEVKKVHFKTLNKAKLFSKSSAKLFILSSIFLYINCLFVPFKFYYIMLAGFNLTIAFALLVFGKKKSNEDGFYKLKNLLNKKPA
ncbi:MAG: hypothetical protein J5689_03020 [Clostridia bacterium]|nr:hypothetical protein [Clostridia bacterium]